MKFKRLLEAEYNKYYRYVLYDQDENKYYGFITRLEDYIPTLKDKNKEIHDEFFDALDAVEAGMEVPNLDFKNHHYTFAFKKEFLDKYKKEIENLEYFIDNYSPYELVLTEVEPQTIDYEDEFQIAYEVS